jgi:hypothetical protein
VDALVDAEVLFDGEGLGADGADVGPLAGVGALVAGQPGRYGEMLAAGVAGELL